MGPEEITKLFILVVGFGMGFLVSFGMFAQVIAQKHDLKKELEKVKEQRDFYSYLIAANKFNSNVTIMSKDENGDYFEELK